jgi:hypothetical protein
MICCRPALSYEIWAMPRPNPILAFSNPSGNSLGARAYPSLLFICPNSVKSFLLEHVAWPLSGGGGSGCACSEAAVCSPEVGEGVADTSGAVPDEISLEQPSTVMSTKSETVAKRPLKRTF